MPTPLALALHLPSLLLFCVSLRVATLSLLLVANANNIAKTGTLDPDRMQRPTNLPCIKSKVRASTMDLRPVMLLPNAVTPV